MAHSIIIILILYCPGVRWPFLKKMTSTFTALLHSAPPPSSLILLHHPYILCRWDVSSMSHPIITHLQAVMVFGYSAPYDSWLLEFGCAGNAWYVSPENLETDITVFVIWQASIWIASFGRKDVRSQLWQLEGVEELADAWRPTSWEQRDMGRGELLVDKQFVSTR